MDKKLLREFERRFGGRVEYLEDINDNNQFTGAVQQRLRQGIPIGRDIVVLTDTTAAQWIRNGWLEPIDWSNIPNRANIAPAWSRFDYDPDGRFVLPYQSGAIGIGYDPEVGALPRVHFRVQTLRPFGPAASHFGSPSRFGNLGPQGFAGWSPVPVRSGSAPFGRRLPPKESGVALRRVLLAS